MRRLVTEGKDWVLGVVILVVAVIAVSLFVELIIRWRRARSCAGAARASARLSPGPSPSTSASWRNERCPNVRREVGRLPRDAKTQRPEAPGGRGLEQSWGKSWGSIACQRQECGFSCRSSISMNFLSRFSLVSCFPAVCSRQRMA
jgi:hypothetical protein